jgi:hypothetical protein
VIGRADQLACNDSPRPFAGFVVTCAWKGDFHHEEREAAKERKREGVPRDPLWMREQGWRFAS